MSEDYENVEEIEGEEETVDEVEGEFETEDEGETTVDGEPMPESSLPNAFTVTIADLDITETITRKTTINDDAGVILAGALCSQGGLIEIETVKEELSQRLSRLIGRGEQVLSDLGFSLTEDGIEIEPGYDPNSAHALRLLVRRACKAVGHTEHTLTGYDFAQAIGSIHVAKIKDDKEKAAMSDLGTYIRETTKAAAKDRKAKKSGKKATSAAAAKANTDVEHVEEEIRAEPVESEPATGITMEELKAKSKAAQEAATPKAKPAPKAKPKAKVKAKAKAKAKAKGKS